MTFRKGVAESIPTWLYVEGVSLWPMTAVLLLLEIVAVTLSSKERSEHVWTCLKCSDSDPDIEVQSRTELFF